MIKPEFPPSRRLATNDIELAVHDAGEGTAVFLLHGFPELGYSWRHQVGPLVEAGFRVLVPNQRGYDGSSAPADVDTYSVKSLVKDLTGVLDALDIERAVFIGHDWGSMPAWYAGVYAPDRVLGVGSLCTPYFAPGDRDLVEEYDEIRGPNGYMSTFQRRGIGEAILERDVEATFRALLRGRGYTLAEFDAAPPEVRELPVGVFVGDPQLLGAPIVTEGELAYYVDAFTRSGFEGPCNWYRALHQDWVEAKGYNFFLDKPALMISAADDWFLPPSTTEGMEELLPQLEKHVIPDCAHWVQQERPEEVSELVLGWLNRHFR